MEEHSIAHFAARYRLPAGSDSASWDRLDRVLRDAVPAALETAFARLGIPEGEQVCVRRIDAPVRLSLAGSDEGIAAAWSLAITDALAATLARGDGVVRYGSKAHALVDLLAGVAARDTSRAWAWRQLDLWHADDEVGDARAIEQACSALRAAPGLIAPVLAEAARAGALATLARRVTEEGWIALARAALDVAGISLGVLAATDVVPASAAEHGAERILRASLIARELAPVLAGWSSPRRSHAAPGDAVRAVAALAFLEVEPAALRSRTVTAPGCVTALATLLCDERMPARVAVIDGRTAEAVSRPAPPARPETPPHSPHSVSGNGDDLAARTASGERFVAPARDAGASSATARDGAEDAARPVPMVRCLGRTRLGGLLFLLHLVAELGLVDDILGTEPLAARPLRWSLHQLALTLVPAAPDDPAVLAFAGLRPGDEPPSARGEHPTDPERAALGAYAARLGARLRERLDRRGEPEGLVLRLVCRRDAEIVADPGWFEVHLSLNDVTTEIRRAGLDLDPGFVPWLGIVVRFAYA